MSKILNELPEEIEEGNIEYKLKIIPDKASRLMSLSSQLRWRCNEGRGMTIYFLGISDKGVLIGLTRKELENSLTNLDIMIKENNYKILQKNITEISPNILWASIIIINEYYNNNNNIFITDLGSLKN